MKQTVLNYTTNCCTLVVVCCALVRQSYLLIGEVAERIGLSEFTHMGNQIKTDAVRNLSLLAAIGFFYGYI